MTAQSSAQLLVQPFDAVSATNPYPVYARLRNEAPVHRIALPDGSPVWLVLRDADVRAGLADPRLSVNKAASGTGYKGFSLPPALDANLLNIDADDHLRLRRLVSKAFTARHIETLRRRVQAAVDQLLDSLPEQGEADLAADFAGRLPITVIGDLFAVPEPDRAPFARWASTMFGAGGSGQIAQAIDAIHVYLLDLIAARRSAPGEDLLSALIAARDDGDKLSENELVSMAFLILMAGSENVQHLITNGVLTLLCHPDQLAAMRGDLSLLPTAVEELLRYAHPNQMAIRRFPTEPVEFSGIAIPPGDTVMLCLASANRDPDRYPDPDQFDIRRKDTAHLALGQGMHYCLGAPLARLQIRTAIKTLVRRFPDLGLAVDVEQLRWRSSWRSHALRELPVTLAPSASRQGVKRPSQPSATIPTSSI
ncbi:cytochrome P450 [Streptomyces scopuliridis]|uniref:cytochrome P450 family protein n=1 Tax=Streptomyces scopuliridis TaxID=452529 RepID=UPI0036C989B1